jgi:hypothetical protein
MPQALNVDWVGDNFDGSYEDVESGSNFSGYTEHSGIGLDPL